MKEKLRDPWLLAVWPGMGGVAISAGYYLMAKLGMHLLIEFPAGEIFDLEQINVKDGLITSRRLPRSRLFLWNDPKGEHDIILFIGEAQPPSRGAAFCRRLIEHVESLGVARVFTFAAMATQMRPGDDSTVFGAAIDRETLDRFKHLGMRVLDNGKISGLNGVLLGVAANAGMTGGCFLGEIPGVFAQIPFPKASLAVLERFTHVAGIEIDYSELRAHAKAVDDTLVDFMNRIERSDKEADALAESPPEVHQEEPSPRPASRERQLIERRFDETRRDRSLAYGLKQELDRLGVFGEYEDRFLDLFKEPE
ncbi:MAG: PAC2 family protein [Luteolibacter sp.]